MSSTTSTYFYALTIRKQLPGNNFERSGRGQEPSRGHKFSILENVVLHRDFTSAMRLHFRSDLVGACLPQTVLIFAPCGAKERRVVVLGIARGRLNIRFGHCTSCLFDNSSVKLCKHDTPLLFAPSGANHEQGLGWDRVCEAQRSNESPSGAFKRQRGLRQQMEGRCPDKHAPTRALRKLAGA